MYFFTQSSFARRMAALAILCLACAFGPVGIAHAQTQAQQYQKVAAGNNHSLAITSDGTLWAWGDNGYGQLGNGTNTVSASPVRVGSGFAQVVALADYTLALKTDNTLWAWGNNDNGQLGTGDRTSRNTPVQIGSGFVQMAVGTTHAAGVKADGTLWTWGGNASGQLGDGSTNPSLRPTLIGCGYAQVAAGDAYTVAVKADATLWAWGRNRDGQLGTGKTDDERQPVRVGNGYVQVAASRQIYYANTVAVKTDGSLWAWGVLCPPANNCFSVDVGGGAPPEITRAPIQMAVGIKHILARGRFAVRLDGTLVGPIDGNFSAVLNAFGYGFKEATDAGDNTVAMMQDGSGYAQVTASGPHSAAIKTDGSLWTWGYNGEGELGNGTLVSSNQPMFVGNDFVKVVAGYADVYAIKTDGGLWAWGSNGYGFTEALYATRAVRPILFGTGYSDIAPAYDRAYGVKKDGSLWAWGNNRHGQFGDGSFTSSFTPVFIGAGYAKVAASNFHTAAIKSDGTLQVWGRKIEQVIDLVPEPGPPSQPHTIGSGFARVAAGGDAILALTQDGQLWRNVREATPTSTGTGTGTGNFNVPNVPSTFNATPDPKVPQWVGSNFASITSGYEEGLAVKTDGTLWAYGGNGGRYGNGNLVTTTLEPVQVGNNFAQVAQGNGHYLGLKTDGTLWGWGRNEFGQLGVPQGPYDSGLSQVALPGTPQFTRLVGQLFASGLPASHSLRATFTPEPGHTQGQLFYVAILPDGRAFTHNADLGWLPLDPGKRVGFNNDFVLTRSQSFLITKADVRDLKGTLIYFG